MTGRLRFPNITAKMTAQIIDTSLQLPGFLPKANEFFASNQFGLKAKHNAYGATIELNNEAPRVTTLCANCTFFT